MERQANTAPDLKRDHFPNAFTVSENTHIQLGRVKIKQLICPALFIS